MVKRWLIPPVWQTRISPRIFFKEWTFVWWEDDWLPSTINQDLYLGIFLKIQHAHGQKMIDPPWMTDQDLT